MKKYNQKKFKSYLLKENMVLNNPLIGGVFASISIPGFLYNTYQIRRNHSLTSKKIRAKVLISDEPLTEWQNLMLGVKGAVAQFFTKRGIRVHYKNDATSDDLIEVLKDDNYQNIILIGHGARDQWCAKDGVVYTKDLDEWMIGLPKKKGYFIQFTCGNKEGKPLGYSVVEDRSKILGYTKAVDLGDRFDSMWKDSLGGIESLINISEDQPL